MAARVESEGFGMTRDEQRTFMASADYEFDWLANKIVHDGRLPWVVAFGMTDKLSKQVNYYQGLWEAREG